ncbi:2-oxo acid dehydrogenase subunit E2 [Streptomyces nitrosporeus]|uniref:Dihydrolipoamide acetyltransferase component of pyruvate dehydrogenase complex n=1 Tax=Streptomyces nitrosporeus TaxID=28894 RepID=A0A5J6FNS8_9ACTN|nr:dihydrolipoamide acetyltransferase family protein [Streptomyces nitrosporeus]QEU76605.1 2-oxo acid dehydrogenase subunit E2 [Streptomyces nitrosporeus]GGZ03927.1 dihydrolipoamide acetyltransferase component of pyruvate dehydrogenase complex [Streptomyces nitrosporeus]
MARVLEFKLPDLGEGLTEAEIVRWLVEVGDVVTIDQPVVEVETAKAMVEVPCPYGGVVTARFGEEGSELPVGAPLLTVAVGSPSTAPDDADTDRPPEGQGRAARSDGGPAAERGATVRREETPESGETAGETAGETSGNVLVGYGTGAPAARRRRVRPSVYAATAQTSAPTPAPGRPGQVPARAGATDSAVAEEWEGPVAVISPLVRKLARRHGLDLRQITGSGREGLILRADVESAIKGLEEDAESVAASAPPLGGPAVGGRPGPVAQPVQAAPEGERIALRGVRGAVADKLSRSRREIPDATCWVDADATELMAARAAMNATADGGSAPKVSVLALLARICTAALSRFPELNSAVDTEAREVVRLPAVHLGFAAQTERGLMVPVVRDAHSRNTESIGAEIGRLTEAARTGKLTPAQLTGGTFTLNNYGVFGVDGSTPIINHPEAAMLGVGRIVAKPWVHEGELAVRQVVQLSLTFDHRVCDGATAGGFLRYVADCVEQPALLLRTL